MINQKKIMPLGFVVFGLVACTESDLSGVTDFENSVAKNSSSSAVNDLLVVDQPVNYDLWTFKDYLADTGNQNSGYWFDFVGSEEGNSSTVEFPVQKGDMSSADYMRSIADACDGICGTVQLRGASPKPVRAGVGLKLSADGEMVDVSAWNGLCVTYRSDLPMRLMLGSGNKVAQSDLPSAVFPKMLSKSTLCSKWSDFKQSASVDGASGEILNKVGDVLFEFEGYSGENGEFNIKGLASYKNVVVQLSSSSQNVSSSSSSDAVEDVSSSSSDAVENVSSSSSDAIKDVDSSSSDAIENIVSSSLDAIKNAGSNSLDSIENFVFNDVCSFEMVDDLWYAPNREFIVRTGLGDGSDTYGYWFDFSDHYDDGVSYSDSESENDSESEVIWPVEIGTIYSLTAKDPVIEYCAGICGIASLGKGPFTNQPYVGVGFYVVGEGERFSQYAVAGDVSDWGGLCVTYASETDMDIVIPFDEENTLPLDLPLDDWFKASLPRSLDVITECVKWSEFVSSTRTFDPTKVASIRFVWRGDDSTQVGFNILGLGKYHELSNPGCKAQESYVSNIDYYKARIGH